MITPGSNVSSLNTQQLLLGSQNFAGVIDLLPDPIFVVDKDARVVAWNRQMETMTGIARQDVLGKSREIYTRAIYGQEQYTLLDYLMQEEKLLPDRFSELTREQTAIAAEEWNQHVFAGEGAQLWANASLLLDVEGSVTGAIQVYRNISFKSITERSLKQVNRALATLSEINHALVQDTSENELLQDVVDIIVHKQRYTMAWIGYAEKGQADSLLLKVHAGFGGHKNIRMTCENRAFGCDPVFMSLHQKQHFLINNICELSDCEKCQEHAHELNYKAMISLPISHNEIILGVLVIYNDQADSFDDEEVSLLRQLADNLGYGITSIRTHIERDGAVSELQLAHSHLEMKVTERTRELSIANERLKELDKLKSMFIASMSHELRTPLNSIIGFSGILLKGLSGELNEKQREHIQRVNDSGKALLELISDVIDIAKLEGDRIEVYPQPVNVNEVIGEVFARNMSDARRKDLYLKFEPDKDYFLYTDQKRLLQTLNNLVSNAIKYTEHGGVRLEINDYYGMFEFSVIDTGIGFAQEDVPKLFEAFERLDSHLKVKEGGTGLGLYLTQKLVTEILCGEIEVESSPGEGSIFKIRVAEDLRKV